ncbi:hypothetical protein D2N39_04580 [Gemmobacter lutimaris]|uniref:Calcium-binding protein n=1 Tax=Gemmobacter lutimaris TaxID=2306023 RepID=A0A398C063_9RHOB|nr:hypothetical protein [Gemmobacter lutimaris]RID92943.1 hypothetical protein D2N39_04580 [Gemmobacter lutimaris]
MTVLAKGGPTPQTIDLHEAFHDRLGWTQFDTVYRADIILHFGQGHRLRIDVPNPDLMYASRLQDSSDEREVQISGDFVLSDDGMITSGRVTELHVQRSEWPGDGYSTFTLSGLDLDAARVMAAAATSGMADDQRLYDSALRGDDLLIGLGLPAADRVLDGLRGDDLILVTDGPGRLIGGAGHDLLESREGRDWLRGGAGNDLLMAGTGADRMYGGGGADVLAAQGGADTMTGGSGADDFVFSTKARGMVIRDFTPGTDRLLFAFADDLSADDLRVVDTADGLRLRMDGFAVTLQGLTRADLPLVDLVFGAEAASRIDSAIDSFLGRWDYA